MAGYAYVDLLTEEIDPDCLRLIGPADAWDYLVLPLRWEGGVLHCATVAATADIVSQHLEDVLGIPIRLLLAETRLLEQFIAQLYEYEGVEIE